MYPSQVVALVNVTFLHYHDMNEDTNIDILLLTELPTLFGIIFPVNIPAPQLFFSIPEKQ